MGLLGIMILIITGITIYSIIKLFHNNSYIYVDKSESIYSLYEKFINDEISKEEYIYQMKKLKN